MAMQRVFITGSNGLVGSYVVAQFLKDGYEVFASSRTGDLSAFNSHKNYRFIQVDFADPFALHDAFEFVQPNVVVHCGAMSRPDDCELSQAEAFDTNVYGTVQLLLNAEAFQSFFIFLSTDFIFDGKKGLYTELDEPAPLSYYGRTKRDAEEAVMEYQYGWSIVRTSFVYGKPIYGRNCFVSMIAQKLRSGTAFKIVDDQYRTPTHATDLARGMAVIAAERKEGVFNLAGESVVTPYQMAIATAEYLKVTNHQLTAVTTEELQEATRRPAKGGLSIEKAKAELNYSPICFEEGLALTLT